jgi:acetyl esterase/lipase
MKFMTAPCIVIFTITIALASANAQQPTSPNRPLNPKLMERVRNATPPEPQTLPLYGESAIPNSRSGPDEETTGRMGSIVKVSRPTIEAFLPASSKATGASIVIFPGGGYVGLSWPLEGPSIGQFFQDHGIAAFVVKYRLPADLIMEDKSIGPLEDAQQAMLVVRQHAQQWKLDPARVGIIGFSAGGHLASSLGTHFAKSYVPNPNQINIRPDFMILIYPVISMDEKIAHMGSRTALLGLQPPESQLKLFSNQLQVTPDTPPTLLLHAADDEVVDVDNSIQFFEALRHAGVQVDMTIFDKGEHGFILIPKDRWQSIVTRWIEMNGWLSPKRSSN